MISDLTLRELEETPEKVRVLINDISSENKEYVTLNEEARKLADHYIEEGVVSENYLVDAQHIAIATVYKVDALASWNFKHILNLNRIRLYNAVNLKYGYQLIEIRSPREIIYEE